MGKRKLSDAARRAKDAARKAIARANESAEQTAARRYADAASHKARRSTSKFIKVEMSTIVQYVLIRGDLIKSLKWPVGALVAQACHASSAVIHLFYNDECTQQYLKDLENMHKIILEVSDEECLKKLSETLTENSISHKMWIEQPENIATCIALKPYPKDEVQLHFKKLKLMK